MKSPIVMGAAIVMVAALPIANMHPIFAQTVDRNKSPRPLGNAIKISAVDLSFQAGQSRVLTITSIDGRPARWTATRTQPWLALGSTSGTTPASLVITAVTGEMAAGNYSDVVTVASPTSSSLPARLKVTLKVAAGAGRQHYVSPSGSARGDGGIDHPWDLQTALSQSALVHPGDKIWIRGGTYGQGKDIFRSSLMGSADAPVIVRQYPGERAIINGWLQVGCCDQDPRPNGGSYVWFWGLEFASSIADRTGHPAGPPKWGESAVLDSVDTWAPGSRFINNIIHDTRMGISMWTEATDAEAYGNVIYNNGFQATDRGHGHGFYVQNNTGTKYIADNIVFNQFDNGIQAYGSDKAQVRNITLEGNIVFNNGVIGGARADNVVFAGGGGVRGARLLNNYFFHTPITNLGYNELGWGGNNYDLTAEGNYFMGGFESVAVGNWQSVTFQNNHVYSHGKYNLMLSTSSSRASYLWNGNTYYGSGMFTLNDSGAGFEGWQGKSQLDRNSSFRPGDPAGTWIFIRPNKYEQGRANIAIYNWDLADSVRVDLGGVLTVGRRYEIRDAQNFLAGARVTGTFDGSPVRVPMTGLVVAMPNGFVPNPPRHTAPQFATFVLIALP